MQASPFVKKIKAEFSGGSIACGNQTKRWNVYKNQTPIGQIKFHLKDRFISYTPEPKIPLLQDELVEVLRIMNTLFQEETRLSVN